MKVRCCVRLSSCLVSLTLLVMMYMFLLVNWSSKRIRASCGQTRQQVFLLRIPKTGTSTTTFMFWRFAIHRNLTVLLPKPTMEETLENIDPNNFELSPGPFDVIANQLIYNTRGFHNYLPPNITYIALLRDPLDHLTSVLNYKGHTYLQNMPEGDPTRLYLQDPTGYETKFGHFVSLTDNPFARYFGLSKHIFHSTEPVQPYISKIDKVFKVVLILEHFNESLIMMKRLLCWTFRDIIYTIENRNRDRPRMYNTNLISKHRRWARLDYQIYNYFNRKLHLYIEHGGDDFSKEVNAFKTMLTEVHEFCNKLQKDRSVFKYKDRSVFTYKGSPYSEGFLYTTNDCELLKSSAVDLRNNIRKRQSTQLE